jgi:hypothetical protein
VTRPLPLLSFVFLVLLVLAACGGGGSGPAQVGGPPTDTGSGNPPAAQGYILVEVFEEDEVGEIADETGATVLGQVPGTGYWRVQLPPGMTVQEFIRELEDDARVVNADPDVALSSPEGDKSTLPAGGLLLASQVPMQPDLVRIGILQAHGRATGLGVRVAVLDTGVVPHELLDANIDPDGWDFVGGDPDPTDERDFKDSDADGVADEGYGHGTFVTSLILAVAPDARIVPLRVLDSDAIGNASTLAAAITMAADKGVDIINLSAGMPERVNVIQDAVQNARSRGVVVIASAGNSGGDIVNFPSAIASAFSVTAVDATDVVAPFASFGTEVDLCAPGVDLLGAFPHEVFRTGTARWSGTSFSAALVSGAYALVRELDPGGDPGDLLQRLEDLSFSVAALNPTLASRLGEGRLDLDAATR